MLKKCLVCGLLVMAVGWGAAEDRKVFAEGKATHGSHERCYTAALGLPLDELFARLEAIRGQRVALAKEEQDVLAQIRDKIQNQRKALEESEKRLKQFEPMPAPPILPPGAVPPPQKPVPTPPGVVPPPPVKDASAPKDGPPPPTAAPSGAVFFPWYGPYR